MSTTSAKTPALGFDTLPSILHSHVRNDDGAEFLRLLLPGKEDRVLSYAELIEHSHRWTQLFGDRGLQPGDRVIVTLPHSVELYAAFIGAMLGGIVPAMFAFPSPKLSERQYFSDIGLLLAGARARMLVTYPELASKLESGHHEALGQARIVTPDAALPSSGSAEPPSLDPDHTALLQYSSGTTGLKKGVALSHRAVLWQVGAYGQAIKATSEDRVVTWLPLYHDMGLIACLLLPLVYKIPIVAMSPFDWVRRPAMWLEAVSHQRGTLSWLPNFAYSFMAGNVTDAELTGIELDSLRGVVNCSEPIMASSHEAFLKRFGAHGMTGDRLACSYAMAENTFAVTSCGFGTPQVADWVDREKLERDGHAIPAKGGGSDARPVVSSGRALPETRIGIVDDHGRPVPDRQVGEITVSSPSLFTGYDNNPEETAGALRDGAYSTGDLGYMADGELFVIGRSKDLIIVGGRNVYPQDIEAIVNEVPGVIAGRTVAFGVPDQRLGTDRLVILAEAEESSANGPEDISRLVRTEVATRLDIVAQDVDLLPPRSLLKSSSGKIARKANREQYLRGREERGTTVTSQEADSNGDLTAAVKRAVSEISGRPVEQLGEDDRILTGGVLDSFALAELFVALEQAAGVRVPDSLRGDAERLDTVAQIAETLRQLQADPMGPSPSAVELLDPAAIPMRYPQLGSRHRSARGFWSRLYRAVFAFKGIRCGPGLRVLGPIVLQLDGDPRNISLGADVTIMPGVHLKVRENGRIIVHDGVRLDTLVCLVAANDARIEFGQNCGLGLGLIINAGQDVLLGRGCLVGPYVVINASDHAIAAGRPIQSQGYEHAPIYIGEDVWLGGSVMVTKGTTIGSGTVVAAGSTVAGHLPPNAIAQGTPARVVKPRT